MLMMMTPTTTVMMSHCIKSVVINAVTSFGSALMPNSTQTKALRKKNKHTTNNNQKQMLKKRDNCIKCEFNHSLVVDRNGSPTVGWLAARGQQSVAVASVLDKKSSSILYLRKKERR